MNALKTLGVVAVGGVVVGAQVAASLALVGERIDRQRFVQGVLTKGTCASGEGAGSRASAKGSMG